MEIENNVESVSIETPAATENNAAAENGTAPAAPKKEEKKSGTQMLIEALRSARQSSGNTGDPAPAGEGGNTEENGQAAEPTAKETGKEPEQKPEENAAFAAARRKAEKDYKTKLEAEKQSMTEEFESSIAKLGLKDPYTGKTIESKKDLDSYVSRRAKDEVENEAKKLGIQKEQLEELVNHHPAILAAEESRREMEKQQEKEAQRQFASQMQADLAEIQKRNPDIKTFDDFRRLDKYDDMYKMIQRGILPSEAYNLVYMDDIINRAAASATQKTLNSAQSKQHLSPMGAGGNTVEIPRAEYALMRKMHPKKTDAQIAELWKRSKIK